LIINNFPEFSQPKIEWPWQWTFGEHGDLRPKAMAARIARTSFEREACWQKPRDGMPQGPAPCASCSTTGRVDPERPPPPAGHSAGASRSDRHAGKPARTITRETPVCNYVVSTITRENTVCNYTEMNADNYERIFCFLP
jgi:hypothetical protein